MTTKKAFRGLARHGLSLSSLRDWANSSLFGDNAANSFCSAEQKWKLQMADTFLAEVTLVSHPDALKFGTGPITSFPTILDFGPVQYSTHAILEDHSIIQPGAVLSVQFRLLCPEFLKDISLGSEFSIWEYRNIGRGRVQKVPSN